MTSCILLGLPRSGTTLLGRILAAPGFFNYEEEPNPVWRYRNFSIYRHDEYSPADATPKIQKYIAGYFKNRTKKTQKIGFLEKTPSNCLRGGFVSEVFPKANYIVLTRAADQIEKSISKKVFGEDSNARLLNDELIARDFRTKVRKAAIVPFIDYPAYFSELRHKIARFPSGPDTLFWGPRPHHWRDLEALPFKDRVSQQVAYMQDALEEFRTSTRARVVSVTYEDLMSDTNTVLGELETFLGVQSGIFPRTIVRPRERDSVTFPKERSVSK